MTLGNTNDTLATTAANGNGTAASAAVATAKSPPNGNHATTTTTTTTAASATTNGVRKEQPVQGDNAFPTKMANIAHNDKAANNTAVNTKQVSRVVFSEMKCMKWLRTSSESN